MTPSDRPTVFLHVGLPKTGTTAIQSVLARHREELAGAGLLYPHVRPEGMFHAAVEVIGWQHWGTRPEQLEGLWAAHCAQARAFPGRSLISHEVLGRARPDQVRTALAELGEAEVHLVVTTRDLARQVTATWQERIKNGRRYTFGEFLDREGVLRIAPAERTTSAFWREQDLLGVLERWGAQLPPDRIHVVVCPVSGAPREELLRRFGAAVGTKLTRFGLVTDRANHSLNAAQVELLRKVNVLLHDRLEQRDYIEVVKRDFTRRRLEVVDGPRLVAPPQLREPFETVTQEWLAEIRRRGYRVHGDLADLAPVQFGGGYPTEPVPAAALVAGVDELLAAMLIQIAELRDSSVGQASPEPVAGPATGSRWRGRLRDRLVGLRARHHRR